MWNLLACCKSGGSSGDFQAGLLYSSARGSDLERYRAKASVPTREGYSAAGQMAPK